MCGFNALKFLIILSLAKHRSKQVWITGRINISFREPKKKSKHLHLPKQKFRMKRILSTGYSDGAFNIAALVLRATFGVMIFLNHGISKLTKFSEMQHTFFDPFHIGHRWSLLLVLFAEVVCSLLLTLGLLSRIAAFVLVIDTAVAVFLFHKGQPVAQFEIAIVFLAAFFTSLLIGPGKYSVDGAMGK